MRRPGARARRAHRRAERGAALLVAMIMIFMLSLLGVSAMRGSALERQMAVNAILAGDVLQAAESANEVVLNDRANLTAAFLASDDHIVVEAPLGADATFDSRVTLRYVGEGNAIGASLNAAQGASSFDALRYVATGDASIASIRTSRRVEQGAFRTAPAN